MRVNEFSTITGHDLKMVRGNCLSKGRWHNLSNVRVLELRKLRANYLNQVSGYDLKVSENDLH